MEQRESTNDAASMDAQIMLLKEECVLGMGQRLSANYAGVKGAETTPSMEECVLGMGQRPNFAASMVAQTTLSREEFA